MGGAGAFEMPAAISYLARRDWNASMRTSLDQLCCSNMSASVGVLDEECCASSVALQHSAHEYRGVCATAGSRLAILPYSRESFILPAASRRPPSHYQRRSFWKRQERPREPHWTRLTNHHRQSQSIPGTWYRQYLTSNAQQLHRSRCAPPVLRQ